ncbi:MAG: GspMb/PilO family protein [Phycisphaeraceae bacterium]
MDLNRREKMIALATLALVLVFLGDRLVVVPAMTYRADLRAAATQQAESRDADERLQAGLLSLEQRWTRLREAGLEPTAAEAEARLLHALRGWASDSGMSLVSLVPERVDTAGPLPRVHVRVVGTGTMRQAVGFLHRVELADVPVRVGELQLAVRRDGADELTLQLRLSTLYAAPPELREPARKLDRRVQR